MKPTAILEGGLYLRQANHLANPLEIERARNKAIIISKADEWGIDSNLALKIVRCESGFDSRAYNSNDPNGGSFGLFQFQKTTFYSGAEKLKIKNPDIWNVQQQSEVAFYLLSQNKWHLWTCARINGIVGIK